MLYVNNYGFFGLLGKVVVEFGVFLCFGDLKDFWRELFRVFEIEIFPFVFKIVLDSLAVFSHFGTSHYKNMFVLEVGPE